MMQRFSPWLLPSVLALALTACGNGGEANKLPPLTDVAHLKSRLQALLADRGGTA